jgi:ABC-2 type transport system ATP-binding protein
MDTGGAPGPTSGQAIIQVRDLVKTYRGGVQAVKGVSFEVMKGEIFGFLGPNGAGKTTTILVLITLLESTAGTATVCGYDLAKAPDEVRIRIGYVSQDIAVDETLTGRENVALQGHFYHLDRPTIEERSREVLEMVDLTDRADSLVSTYSGGMRKRLDIAEGLIHRPSILFLDEPTLGLDIQTRTRIWEYVRNLRDREGITVFMTTHYMDEADKLCDRIAIIDHGEIVAIGPPAELKAGIGGDLLLLEVDGRPAPGKSPTGEPDDAGKAVAARPAVASGKAVAARPADASDEAATAAASEEAAKFGDFLRGLEGVTKVSTADDGRWMLVVKGGEEIAPKVLAAVSGQGLVVRSLAMKKPTLDDVFLHYTGRALREDEGASGFLRQRMSLRRARM